MDPVSAIAQGVQNLTLADRAPVAQSGELNGREVQPGLMLPQIYRAVVGALPYEIGDSYFGGQIASYLAPEVETRAYDAHLTAGDAFFSQRKYAEAERCYLEALSYLPDDSWCHTRLAAIYETALPNPEKMIVHANKVIKDQPYSKEASDFHLLLSNLYTTRLNAGSADANDRERMIFHATAYVELNPSHPTSALLHLSLGHQYTRINLRLAIAHYKAALQINPNFKEAHEYIVETMLDLRSLQPIHERTRAGIEPIEEHCLAILQLTQDSAELCNIRLYLCMHAVWTNDHHAFELHSDEVRQLLARANFPAEPKGYFQRELTQWQEMYRSLCQR